MSRARDYCFTLNNPSYEEVTGLSTIVCKYICYGEEVGESGTPHLQGFLQFQTPKSLKYAKKQIPRAHFEPRRGTPDEARTYCMKDGKFTERGTFSKGQGARTDVTEVCTALRTQPYDQVVSQYEGFSLYHSKSMLTFYNIVHKPPLTDYRIRDVHWYHGPTGSGKTRKAYELAVGRPAWRACGGLEWFDGVDSTTEVCILDDYRDSWGRFDLLLRLLDGYPVSVPILSLIHI